jgi:long-chain acyl-CoA synthetase
MIARPSLDRDALRRKSAPLLLCERARAQPDAIAFRSKYLGLYRERSWRDYTALVARTARGFAALGLRQGDRVAIMGDACEEWVICDLAAQSLGAIVYGIYPTASASEMEYQLRDGGAVMFIAENQEYVDKLLPIADRLHELNWIVVLDETAMFGYAHRKLAGYRDLLTAAGEPDLAWLEQRAAQINPAAPAFIVYTSGTTGPPKGALVAHGKHLAATANIIDHYPTLVHKEHRTVGYLPLCHVLGRDVAVTLPLISGLVPHFGEDSEDLATTLFETAPTVLFTVPRYLQKFASQILLGIHNSSRLKRRSADFAMRLARAHARRRWNGAKAFGGDALYRACRAGVFMPILNKLGLNRLELVVCAGAPASGDYGALADARRQRCRDVRANRDRGRHHLRPARPVSTPGRRRNRARRLAGEACHRRRSAREESRPVRGLLEQSGGHRCDRERRRLVAHRGYRRMACRCVAAGRSRARLYCHLRWKDHLSVFH